MPLSEEKVFIQNVMDYYSLHGRNHLPWRKTHDAYCVLVSEIMLQQTQVERVIPKYQAFLKRFSSSRTLAAAPLSEVLMLWQGLGYNRRAKMLHRCAQTLATEYGGVVPHVYEKLLGLPGVGPYTAHAVLAFAFDIPVVMIETNIRSAYLHHFFQNRADVSDREILPIISATLDTKHPRVWYAALMDYGAHIKSTHPNPSRKSAHHTKQKPFQGSDRQIRGTIMRLILASPRTRVFLGTACQVGKKRLDDILLGLLKEGLLQKEKNRYIAPH